MPSKGRRKKMKKLVFITMLLLIGASVLVMSGLTNARVIGGGEGESYWTTHTTTYNWKDVFGLTVVTTKLTQNWEYTGTEITWHSKPQYTWSKAPWLLWAYVSGMKSGTWVENPGHYYIGWGTGHWNVGIPSPWGNIGLSQDLYTEIGYYDDGSYWDTAGFGYLS